MTDTDHILKCKLLIEIIKEEPPLLDLTSARPSIRFKSPPLIPSDDTGDDDYPRLSPKLLKAIVNNIFPEEKEEEREDKMSGIAIFSSVFEGFSKIYHSFPSEKTNAALFLSPCFGYYTDHAKENNMKPGVIDSLGGLERYLASDEERNAKTITITNPNNPDGKIMKKDYMDKLVNILKEHDIVVMCDEVFCDLLLTEEAQKEYTTLYQFIDKRLQTETDEAEKKKLSKLKDNIVIFGGCSKRGKPGIRVSYGYFSSTLLDKMGSNVADVMSLPTNYSQAIAALFLDDSNVDVQDFLKKQIANYREVLQEMQNHIGDLNYQLQDRRLTQSVELLSPEAGNVCLLDFSALKGFSYKDHNNEDHTLETGYDVTKFLLEKCSIGAVPGELSYIPKGDMQVRFNLAMTKDELSEAFGRIQSEVKSLSFVAARSSCSGAFIDRDNQLQRT